jgi:hypothetical protein
MRQNAYTLALLLSLCGPAWSHIAGLVFPIYEIPTIMLPNLRDGTIEDWESILPGTSLDHNSFAPLNVSDGAGINPEDLAYRIFMAWHSASQTVWIAVERVDDVYVNTYQGGNLTDLWRFDSIDFMVDGDHTGGSYNGFSSDDYTADEIKLLNNFQAQQYQAVAESPDGRTLGHLGSGQGWVTLPPYADAGGFSVGESPNTSAIEMMITPWDELTWQGPELSRRSLLVAGNKIGFQFSIPDFDTEAGAYHGFHTLSGQPNTWRLAENFVDGELVPCNVGDCGAPPGGGIVLPPLESQFLNIIVTGPSSECASAPPIDCTTLIAGFADGATDELDRQIGEVRLPPIPPTIEIFDVRFLTPGGDGLHLDLRDHFSGPPVWQITLQAGLAGVPVTLTWDPVSLPPGGWRLRNLDGTQVIDVDMTGAESLVISDPMVTALTLTDLRTVTLHYPPGWSMVSIPVVPMDNSLGVLFPDALSAFGFDGGYDLTTQLSPCRGYWLNLTAGGDYTLTGDPVSQCDGFLPANWSLRGTPLNGTRVENIIQNPPSSLATAFTFEGAYVRKTGQDWLAQGQAFWVDMVTAGQVTLNSDLSGAARRVPTAPEVFAGPVLWAQSGEYRQEIHLGVEPDQALALPPLPPAGLLDLRANIGGVSTDGVPLSPEQAEYPINVQGTHSLGWDMQPAASSQWQLIVDGEIHALVGRGSVTLQGASNDVRLLFTPSPHQFSLSANYPNPFNPATTIRYELKHDGPASLVVYDITGQMVRSLVASEQPAGRYTITWDGRNTAGTQAASGVYLYELRAGSYRSVQKMLLMK